MFWMWGVEADLDLLCAESRGVNPSETMMHFPLVSYFPLFSKKFLTLRKIFTILPFPEKLMLVDAYRYKLFKKPKGALGKKFLSARVVDLWNGLNDSTVAVD